MNRVLYYAVHGSGQGVVFTTPPVRDDRRKIWIGEMSGIYSSAVMQMESEGMVTLPPLKWTDDPVMLKMDVGVCSEGHR